MDSLFYFLDAGFWSRTDLLILFTVSIFSIVLIRYFLSATLYHYVLLQCNRSYRLLNRLKNKQQLKREILWASISSVIFALLTVGSYYLFQLGKTKIYTDITQHSLLYFGTSIVLVLVLYETYYYWLHRWMHKPRIFKLIHKVHHDSIHTSVFTSFSFHPLEAILQFIFLPLLILVVPIHYCALGIVLMLMTISSVINHAGAELFSKKFLKGRIGKWLIGSTHHDLHHREFKNNYGLYLTVWDRWMKTESKNYEKLLTDETINQSRSQHHQ